MPYGRRRYYGRFKRRRVTFKRGPSRRITKRVKRVERRVKRIASTIETKYRDFAVNGTDLTTTPSSWVINAIPNESQISSSGTDFQHRVGSKVRLTSLYMSFWLGNDYTVVEEDAWNVVRLILVWDKMPQVVGTIPSLDQIMATDLVTPANPMQNILAPPNWTRRGNYRILMDKKITFSSQGGMKPFRGPFNINLKLGKDTYYADQISTNITKGALYLYAYSDSTSVPHPYIYFYRRIKYQDA